MSKFDGYARGASKASGSLGQRNPLTGVAGGPIERVLLDVGQQVGEPAPVRAGRVVREVGVGRERAAVAVIVVNSQRQLLEVIRASRPGGGLADLLDRRK